MAELKNGSTVGGNLIHHSGNSGTPQTNWYGRDIGITGKYYFFSENTYNGEKLSLATTGGHSSGNDKCLTLKNVNGWLTIGAMNSSYCHIWTDRPGFHFDKNIETTGDIKAGGAYYYGDNKKIIRFDDAWLRINPDGQFSSGVFFNQSVVRTDKELQVGDGGNKFRVESTGTTTINSELSVSSAVNVGNKSGDNYSTFKHITANGYGFTFQHGTASVVVNEQGGKTQALVLGDNDNNNGGTLLGTSISSDGSTWIKKLNLTAAGELYLGQTGTTRAFHDNYHPNADKLTTARQIALTGDVTGSANFDGGANVSITATVQDNSHNHTSLTGVTRLTFNAYSNDGASLSTTIDSDMTYFDFNLSDDISRKDKWRWRFSPSSGTTYSAMELSSITTSQSELKVSGPVLSQEIKTPIINTQIDGNLSIRRNGQERIVLHSGHTEVKNILTVNSGISIGDSSDHIAASTLKGSDSNINQDGVDSSGELQVQYDGCNGTRSAVRAGIFRAHESVYAKAMNFHSGDSKIDRKAGIEYNKDTNSIDFVFT